MLKTSAKSVGTSHQISIHQKEALSELCPHTDHYWSLQTSSICKLHAFLSFLMNERKFKTAGTRAISFRQSTIFFKEQPLIGRLFDVRWLLIAKVNPEKSCYFQKMSIFWNCYKS